MTALEVFLQLVAHLHVPSQPAIILYLYLYLTVADSSHPRFHLVIM